MKILFLVHEPLEGFLVGLLQPQDGVAHTVVKQENDLSDEDQGDYKSHGNSEISSARIKSGLYFSSLLCNRIFGLTEELPDLLGIHLELIVENVLQLILQILVAVVSLVNYLDHVSALLPGLTEVTDFALGLLE